MKSFRKNPEQLLTVRNRKWFYLTGMCLYFSAPVVNLFSVYACAVSVFSFLFYILLVLRYCFAETESSYWNIGILFIIVGFFVYPSIYKYTENAGVYLKFKNHEVELSELIKEINSNRNITQISEGMLNCEFIQSDPDIFDNFYVTEKEYNGIIGKMNNLSIGSIQVYKNYVKVYSKNFGKMIYTKSDIFSESYLPEGNIDLYLGNNWYKWSYK